MKTIKIPENAQCYCCNKTATTKDHIPPKCFFPKKKDCSNDSPDYRSDLITVPSCLEHNNSRSKDDEYTAAAIVMNSKSDLAFTIFKSKWVQTLLRREGALGKKIFSTARSARVISQKNGILIPSDTLAISYEVERINRVIESIARALYYHESGYKKKWEKSCIIKSLNFLNRDLGKPSDFYFLESIIQNFLVGLKKKVRIQMYFIIRFLSLKKTKFLLLEWFSMAISTS